MDAIVTYIEKLAQISPYIKLYRDFNSNVILRNIGKSQERLINNMWNFY